MNDIQKIDAFIANLHAAKLEIRKTGDIRKIKRFRDELETVREFARLQGAQLETTNELVLARTDTECWIGELIRGMLKHPGGRPTENGKPGNPFDDQRGLPDTLADIGLSYFQSHRWQAMAEIADEERKAMAAKATENRREFTSLEIYKAGRDILTAKKREEYQSTEQFVVPATVARMDAREYLGTIEPGSVDLLLTDPPYSTDVEDIDAFARSWLALGLSRVKPAGRAYIFIGAYPAELYAYLDAVYRPRPGAEPHAMQMDMILPWVYRNTLGPSPKDRYKLNWQACLYFIGPEAPPLNDDDLNNKFSVQDIRAPDGRLDEIRFHAWEKPAEIAERFIRHATEPGETILDPFTGTGCFLAAAARLGRIGIGCEVDEEMLTFCRQRGIA